MVLTQKKKYRWDKTESSEIYAPMDTLSLTKEAKIYNGEKTVSSNNWCRGNWAATCKRMKLKHFLTTHTNINSKWIKDLNVKTRNYNALRGKHRQYSLT